jgi:hypothetical protein
MLLFFDWSERVVQSYRKVGIVCDSPGPETLTKTTTDRSDKRLIRVADKEVFKEVNVDQCNDIKERHMVMNSLKHYCIIKFI